MDDSINKPRKRRKKKQGENGNNQNSLGTFGSTPAWVMARSSTRYHESDRVDSRGAQKISGMLVEGVMIWEQGIIKEEEYIEASFLDSHENEQLVEKEMCTRISVAASIPFQVGIGILQNAHALVDKNDTLTHVWSIIFEQFYADCIRVQNETNKLLKAYPNDPDLGK